MASTDLAKFAPVFTPATFDRGTVDGKVQLSGTPAEPRLEGALVWKGGRITFPTPWQPVEAIETKLGFRGNEAVFEETRGRMGEGTFGLAGKIGLAGLGDPQWDIALRGDNLSLYADENLALRGSPDLAARGTKAAGEIKGTLGLDGSAVLRSLAITPQPVAAPPAVPAGVPANPAGALAAWTLDLKMSSTAPIPVGPGGAEGSLLPDLYLQGSVGGPLLLGTVQVDRLQVAWPSGATLAAGGRLHFTREKPWQPVLDLTGAGEAGPYDIRAGIFGTLGEGQLLLSSSPPLATGPIVLLLTTGLSPLPSAIDETAVLTPEQKMNSEPSWLYLDKVRGLLGWGTDSPPDVSSSTEWSLGSEAIGYEWSWR